MKNLDINIEGNILIIKVNLDEEHGDSQRGVSTIVASSQGNLQLHDGNGYRPEILNMTVTRRKPQDKRWT